MSSAAIFVWRFKGQPMHNNTNILMSQNGPFFVELSQFCFRNIVKILSIGKNMFEQTVHSQVKLSGFQIKGNTEDN